jgi:hypothetical protein
MIIDWAIYYQQNKHLPLNKIMEGYNRLLMEYQEQLKLITQQNSLIGAGPGGSDEPSNAPVPPTLGALVFGSTDYVQITSDGGTAVAPAAFGNDDFTFEYWINLTTNDNGFITTITNLSGPVQIILLSVNSNALKVNISGDTYTLIADVTPLIDTWTHVAFSRTYPVDSVYVGGNLVLTQSDTSTYSVGNTFNIGSILGQNAFIGKISNIRIVNGTALYDGSATITIPSAPLSTVTDCSALLLAETSGTITTDSSGNNALIVDSTGVGWESASF